MRTIMIWDAIRALLLTLAASNNSNNNDVAVDRLRQRLQMGYEVTEEAKTLVQQKQYSDAAQSFADALNFGRKSAVAFQELVVVSDDDNDSTLIEKERTQALEWLVDIFCESSQLQSIHLNDCVSARKDAWAACMFSQYQSRRALECMKQVCEQEGDWMGEVMACQNLLKLRKEEALSTAAQEEIRNHIKELKKMHAD